MTTEVEHRPEQWVEDSSLFALIQSVADNKYWLGRRFAEWCTAAPTLESAVAAAAMAQDEIGHARSLYPMFRRFVGRDIEPEDRTQFHNIAMLDHPFSGWVDFVAVNFLVDTALTILFESALESSYDDLRNRARRITGEEQVHWLHAKGWVHRLGGETATTRERLQEAIDQRWADAVTLFGPDGDEVMQALVERGVLRDGATEMRSQFVGRVTPQLESSGLTAAKVEATTWDRWDAKRRRLG